jgi:hypothetical protein
MQFAGEGATDEVEEWIGVPGKHPVRSSVDFVTRSRKGNRTLVVALEGRTIAVVAVAVCFNDDPLGGQRKSTRYSSAKTLT